jgi:predicted DNA-binding transcriptional regulator AlpA
MGTLPNGLINLLNEYQVAEMLAVSVATVRRWRWLRTGPRFHKIGALCRYRIADLEEYLRSTRTGGGSQVEGR